MDQAIDLAKSRLSDIHTVTEWSELMRYKKVRSFSEEFQECFGERPVKALARLKLDRAIGMLKEDKNVLHYKVAKEIGLANEQALYKFIKFHTGKTPSHFKNNKRVL